MKLHQMMMIDVAQSAEFEIAETADARFVDAVFCFVVVVVLTVAPIADFSAIDAPMTVKQMNVSVLALMLMTIKMIICWLDDIFFNFDAEKFLIQNLRFLLCCCLVKWCMNVNYLMQVFFLITFDYFFRCLFRAIFLFRTFSSVLTIDILMFIDIHMSCFIKKKTKQI